MKKENNFFEKVSKHRKMITFVLIFILLLSIFLPGFWIKASNVPEMVEMLYYISQIVAACCVIIGTTVAVWQYYLSSSQRMHQKDFERVEKAIDLADYYKDNILTKYSFVKSVFDTCGIMEVITPKREEHEIKDFDVYELRKVYSPSEIKQFEQLSTNKKFIETIIHLNNTFDMGLKGVVDSKIFEEENGKKVTKTEVNLYGMVNDFFDKYICKILNDTEYFAMSFVHNIADESVIYQSIYPTYLEMCFVMYYFIAVYSDPAVAKLYTNIACLYNEWRKKEKSQKEEISKRTRAIGISVGTVYKKNG